MQRANRGLVSILVLIAVVATFASSEPVRGRAANSTLPATRTGAITSSAAHHDRSPRLAQIAGALQQAQHTDHPAKAIPRHQTGNASVSGTSGPNPAPAIPATLGNFEGVGAGFAGPAGTFSVTSAPPDTNAAVGPNHIVEMVNTSFAIFNKSGTVVYGPVATNTIWSGFGGGCQTNNDGDGSARYDSIADRWVLEQFSVSTTPYLECVAVSVTSDPTGAYSRYSFQYTDFPDYPKISVWPDAYYVTFNKFAGGTTFSGGLACAYDRTRMLQGLPVTQQCFDFGTSPTVCTTTPTLCYGGLLTADLDGSRLPPAGSPNYILALDTSSALAFWRFHVDWTTPASTTLTGPIAIPTASYAIPCGTSPTGTCIPQQGTNQQLDSLADRLMYRFAYRNFGDHEALVTNHTVIAGNGTGIRWYEIRMPGTTPSLFQQGTYAPDNNFRWMGSIAMDNVGNTALGFSLSSSSMHPAIHYTGRLASDANGVMAQGEGTIINGAGSQTGTLSRWGDYTSMAIDPTDDCTFWYANEYLAANGAFNWHTRLGSFKFPSCGPAQSWAATYNAAATPASWTANQTKTYSVTVTNAGSETWPVAGPNLVHLGVHFASAGGGYGNNYWYTDQRFSLPADLALGASATLSIAVTAPANSGNLVLEYQMVKEQQFWFSQFAEVSTNVTSVWAAMYSVSGTPTSWTSNQTQTYGVTITNTGNQIWPAAGSNPVHLGVHFASAGGGYGNNYWYTDQRFSLPADLAPGASTTLSIAVTAPANSGNLVIEYQIAKEQQFWLSQFADVSTNVTSVWTTTYSVSGTPTSWTSNQTQTYRVTITNIGNQIWPAGGSNPVHLGVHFASAGGGYGTNYWYTDQRYSLSADLAPGASVTLTIAVTAPANTGNLVLEYQMVKEQQFWFSQFAGANVTVA